MRPKSSSIPSDEYHSQDIVHGIGEKPSSTDCGSPCRADTPKEMCGGVLDFGDRTGTHSGVVSLFHVDV